MANRKRSGRRVGRKQLELVSDTIVPGGGGFYDHPPWYDVVHARGTALETDALLGALGRYCDRRVDGLLEPACGTGRYLRALAQRGQRVQGYDLNPNMVEYARRRLAKFGARALVETGDMTRFVRRGQFDAAFNLINSFRLLHDDDAALEHLKKTAECLKRGGVYVVGIDLATYDMADLVEDTWAGRRGSLEVEHLLISLPIDRARRRERIVNHITATTPGRTVHLQSTFDLRSYDAGQWLDLVSRSAFCIRACLDREWRPIELTAEAGDVYFILARRRDW